LKNYIRDLKDKQVKSEMDVEQTLARAVYPPHHLEVATGAYQTAFAVVLMCLLLTVKLVMTYKTIPSVILFHVHIPNIN
jgi:hypothetical protein